MSTLNGQELELFRAGDYGAKGKYTSADIRQLAADYDPAAHEAPICVGHPKMNAPAFGWMKKLRADGDMLFGTPGEVDPAFDKAVQAGRFKKRSVALLRGQDGKLQLRHVGFLGAMPPEVLGLKDATFSGEQFDEIEFSDASQGESEMADEQKQKEEQKRNIVEVLIEMFSGKEKNGKTSEIAPSDLSALEARLEAKFSAELAVKDAKITSLEASFASQNSSTATTRRIEGVINTLKANGRWVKAFDVMKVPEIFVALAAAPAQEIVFAAAGDKPEVKLDPVAAFERFLGGMPKLVPQGVLFSGDQTRLAAAPASAVNASPESVQFNAAITARMKEKSISYVQAHDQLRAEGVSHETFGSASAGEV